MNDSSIEYLFSYLQEFSEIPFNEKNKITDRINFLHLDKDDFFVKQGSKPERLALISSGIFRVYCLTESGEEKTLAFRVKGQFVAAFSPYLTGQESWYSIQALSDGDLVSIPIKDYTALSAGHPCWDKIINKMIIKLFIEKEDRERSFLTEDAATRYLQFRLKYPEIEDLVPQFYIASYLGISPVSLSRIRKKIKNNSN